MDSAYEATRKSWENMQRNIQRSAWMFLDQSRAILANLSMADISGMSRTASSNSGSSSSSLSLSLGAAIGVGVRVPCAVFTWGKVRRPDWVLELF